MAGWCDLSKASSVYFRSLKQRPFKADVQDIIGHLRRQIVFPDCQPSRLLTSQRPKNILKQRQNLSLFTLVSVNIEDWKKKRWISNRKPPLQNVRL